MIDFAGRRMPLLYSSIIDEHFQVRTRAGLFDVSHMGRLLLRGPGAVDTVQRLVAGDISHLSVGQARYTVLLTPWGGIQDDLILYRRDDGLLLVVNAARRADDRAWIEENLRHGTSLDDLTELTALLALQGPQALAALQPLTSVDLDGLRPFTFAGGLVAGAEATILRTGYTGEDGVELMTTADEAARVWEALLAAAPGGSVRPCGLGARDTLRLEAALLLYGQDITKNTTPFEARLDWLVDLDRPGGADFVGRDALLEARAAGPEKLLVGLATDARSIPRSGDLIALGVNLVGKVTSGSMSPVLGHPIALGYVFPQAAATGTEVVVVSGEREIAARVVDRPFYKRGVTPIPPHTERHRPSERAE